MLATWYITKYELDMDIDDESAPHGSHSIPADDDDVIEGINLAMLYANNLKDFGVEDLLMQRLDLRSFEQRELGTRRLYCCNE